jgi:chemotaxis protein methyltransferase CheR
VASARVALSVPSEGTLSEGSPKAVSATAALYNSGLSSGEFGALAALIKERAGIRLPPSKKGLLEGRLRRRLVALDLRSYSDYCALVLGPSGSAEEIARMIDAVTTNKTDFFREASHFRFLTDVALPRLLSGDEERRARPTLVADPALTFWSAACSSGEEVWTLAMVLAEAQLAGQRFRPTLLGTDICRDVLAVAKQAIYPETVVAPVPLELRRRYLLRSKARDQALVRVVPALRAQAHFSYINLLHLDGGPRHTDVIFCRNVLIYFDRPTQQRVLSGLCRALRPGGYLFLGHSDSVTGLDLPLEHLMPSVYRKRGGP